jgi:uncharacterized protein YkwD
VPVLAPGGAEARDGASSTLTTLELSTIDSINALRVSHGVAPLELSHALFASAMLHCRQMAEGGYFSHDGPNGSTFAARMDSFYPQRRHELYSVGENLLWTLTPVSGAAMVASWMKSPEHRANLLNPSWRQLAIAVLTVPVAPGMYHDGPVTLVTLDFGVRE